MIVDVANTKLVLQNMNTRGGGTAGAGVGIAELAASIKNPCKRSTVDLLNDAATAGYCSVIGHSDCRNNDADAIWRITASGVTYANS
jgi:hypothetical protein